ncbi:2-methylisocitrate lyase-like PEP mutase family enzyme [Paenarthrobacter nitroguajacolicus]|uniref:isocitrate lyase/PEP mutase family protein n=1 Tax=Paenarthrobacter nitroguajacolicus TaxID=211146 RepID=UPI00285AB68C|nr:isocitrate lyase/phosphoenolpyruvate mutase family protein [Paenarthrobacter nitroguajacolicus]MDR6988643.1 2-methylisocitrate lyase-like PEP mutase family enzyme [Paenarthrobacter nitroguajacolicus]
MNPEQNRTAAYFRSLHTSRKPLALSNAWDVASAVITEAAGAPAVATTSAGVAWSLGVPDGDRLDRERAVAVVAGIVNAVKVPVTADIEGGFSTTLEGVGRTVRDIIGAGAVGINMEDGSREPAEFCARISAARTAAREAGQDLFINARTDVFLAGAGTPEQQVAEVLARADMYVQAGADGIFVPGAADAETVAALTAGMSVPVNVMVGSGSLSVAGLGRLGVARVSLGSSIAQAAYAVVKRATEELNSVGTYSTVADALDYGTVNDLLATTGKAVR